MYICIALLLPIDCLVTSMPHTNQGSVYSSHVVVLHPPLDNSGLRGLQQGFALMCIVVLYQ